MRYLLFAVLGIVSAQATSDAVFKKDIVALARSLRACAESETPTEGDAFHQQFDAPAIAVAKGLSDRGYSKEAGQVQFLTELQRCLTPHITHIAIPALERVAGYL